MSALDFRLLADHLLDPVFICDEDGLVVYANAPALELTGQDMEWLEENPADSWLWGPDGLLWPPTGEVREQDLTLSTEERDRKVRGVVGPLPVAGQMGWMIHIREQPRSEEKLAGMQAVAAVVGQQLAQHLRTILSNASEGLMESPDEDQARVLRNIYAAGQAAANLQRQVAALGGQNENQMQPCTLGALVLDAEQSLAGVLSPALDLRIDAEDGAGQILGDPDALGLLLIEMAEWYKARHPGPGGVHVGVQDAGEDRVRLVFTSDGPALDAQERADLFDPTSSDRLGLALVSGVVTRHGGRVLVDSGVGIGTTFHLEFPSHGHEVRRRRALEGGSETVLVVEDDPSVLEWVEQTLTRKGYQVLTAENGIAASVLLREQHDRIDLLLADAVLPGRSGPELIAEARAISDRLAVLLMSGYSEEFLGDQLQGDVSLLRKPFGPAVLVERIREMLDR